MEKIVTVTQEIMVEVDETTFTEEFMNEFKKDFYDFETIDDHIKHLAQLYARGLVDENSFIEGYGPAANMGIKFESIDQWEDIEEG